MASHITYATDSSSPATLLSPGKAAPATKPTKPTIINLLFLTLIIVILDLTNLLQGKSMLDLPLRLLDHVRYDADDEVVEFG